MPSSASADGGSRRKVGKSARTAVWVGVYFHPGRFAEEVVGASTVLCSLDEIDGVRSVIAGVG
jgi:hypothetical protein